MLSPATKIDSHRARRSLLRAVASFEFIKGIFVLLIGLCAILLVRTDAWVMAETLLTLFHISTDRHVAQVFLDFADNLTDTRLWAAANLAFVYSALRSFYARSIFLCPAGSFHCCIRNWSRHKLCQRPTILDEWFASVRAFYFHAVAFAGGPASRYRRQQCDGRPDRWSGQSNRFTTAPCRTELVYHLLWRGGGQSRRGAGRG